VAALIATRSLSLGDSFVGSYTRCLMILVLGTDMILLTVSASDFAIFFAFTLKTNLKVAL
tara:strand:- start:413 stop:592 length:180 start_codon:yes stop_codon:yes gene_type:complete